jgi:hexokinase
MAQHDTLTTLTLNQIISHPFGEHPFKDISEDDLDIVVQIGQAILDRAARLCALKVAASLSLNTKPNTALHPICINVDGSTIHKMKGYHSQFEHELKRVLKAKGIHVMLVQKEHSPILGSAIAALTNG